MRFFLWLFGLIAGFFSKRKENAAVKADRDAHRAETAERTLAAERKANERDEARAVKIEAANDQTTEALENAKQAHPDIRPAGPVTRAVADSLREE